MSDPYGPNTRGPLTEGQTFLLLGGDPDYCHACGQRIRRKAPMTPEAKHARAIKAAAARAASLSPERRSEIARIAAKARWANKSACKAKTGSA